MKKAISSIKIPIIVGAGILLLVGLFFLFLILAVNDTKENQNLNDATVSVNEKSSLETALNSVAPKPQTTPAEPSSGCLLIIEEDSLGLSGYYPPENMAWAWAFANNQKVYGNSSVTMKLFQDWNADANGQFSLPNTHGYGITGGLVLEERPNKNLSLTLDLNGHTINRGLTKATKMGQVVFVGEQGNFYIKNGTITGGFNEQCGGGICHFCSFGAANNLSLENLTIKNNQTNDCGAGICTFGKAYNRLTMSDVTISENTATSEAGGVFLDVKSNKACTSVFLVNKVICSNNKITDSKSSKNADFVLDCDSSFWLDGISVNEASITDVSNLDFNNSKIGICTNMNSFAGQRTHGILGWTSTFKQVPTCFHTTDKDQHITLSEEKNLVITEKG